MAIIQFWTGEGFVGGGTAAYRDAKLYRTRRNAEDDVARMVLQDPKRFMGRLEVSEQTIWRDLWE